MRERKELRRVREGLRRKWRGDGRKGRTLKILHSVPPSLSGLCATQKTVARANVYNKHRACKKMEWIKGSEGLNKPVRRRVSLPSGSKEGGESVGETVKVEAEVDKDRNAPIERTLAVFGAFCRGPEVAQTGIEACTSYGDLPRIMPASASGSWLWSVAPRFLGKRPICLSRRKTLIETIAMP